jgi:hypothetical protein
VLVTLVRWTEISYLLRKIEVMPVSAKKRKADSIEHSDFASSSQSSQKRCRKIKSAEGTRSMELFLHDICANEIETDTKKSEVLAAIRKSSMLINSLLRCHERFVRIVASELTISTSSTHNRNKNPATVRRIGERNVQQALKELGMVDIYLDMKQHQAVGTDSNGAEVSDISNRRKQRKERRVKQWTEEEILEQERLLASSKEKLLRKGD